MMNRLSVRPELDAGADLERVVNTMTRRSLFTGCMALLGGAGIWHLVRTARYDGGIPWPLRTALQLNEQLARDYFRPDRLAPTFPLSAAGRPKVNGMIGMESAIALDMWTLMVEPIGRPAFSLILDDLKSLPKVEITTELKCIAGWSRVVQWTGARFADFVHKYARASRYLGQYVALETPNGQYYVGLDMPSAMHPQTILCYEMNGAALTMEHGAPLRLVTPLKYGIKNLKRIGKITFGLSRPRDFWAERGYDWYAGL